MTVFAVSTVQQNLKYYTPLRDYLSGDGAYIFASKPIDTSVDSKSLSNYSEYFDEALYAGQILLGGELTDAQLLKAADGNLPEDAENPFDSNAYAYYENVIDLYTPVMIDGDWLSEADKYEDEENVFHAVISENDYGLKVGDEYTQSFPITNGGYKNFKI